VFYVEKLKDAVFWVNFYFSLIFSIFSDFSPDFRDFADVSRDEITLIAAGVLLMFV